jgi:putative oxidoreductase
MNVPRAGIRDAGQQRIAQRPDTHAPARLPCDSIATVDPIARCKSIGMSKGFTIFLGSAEIAGGLGVAFGVFTQLAAMGLILLMLGAIQKKVFVWHTGFWGKENSGWHYDLIFIVMNLVIAFTNGGRFVLDQFLPFLHS